MIEEKGSEKCAENSKEKPIPPAPPHFSLQLLLRSPNVFPTASLFHLSQFRQLFSPTVKPDNWRHEAIFWRLKGAVKRKSGVEFFNRRFQNRALKIRFNNSKFVGIFNGVDNTNNFVVYWPRFQQAVPEPGVEKFHQLVELFNMDLVGRFSTGGSRTGR